MDDAALIASSFANPEAFGGIFDRHFDAIFRFCVRRAREEGEDLAGTVFCWAFEHRRAYDGKYSNARPWLYGIANNLVRRSARGSSRRGSAYERWAILGEIPRSSPEECVDESIDARQYLERVAISLQNLPLIDAESLVLYAFEHMSYQEISEAIGLPAGTVKSRINRARNHLIEEMHEYATPLAENREE